MAKVIGNIVAPNGKYLKDGQEKTRWLRCGILMETDNGLRIKLDCLPIGGSTEGGLWLSVFDVDTEGHSQGSSKQTPSRASQSVVDDEDLPF